MNGRLCTDRFTVVVASFFLKATSSGGASVAPNAIRWVDRARVIRSQKAWLGHLRMRCSRFRVLSISSYHSRKRCCSIRRWSRATRSWRAAAAASFSSRALALSGWLSRMLAAMSSAAGYSPRS